MATRRAFLRTLTGGLLAAPLAAGAQQTRRARVGWLLPDPKAFALDPFRQRLKELGWIEGENLVIEERYSHSAPERYLRLAAELVRLKVDILVTDGSGATRAAQQTTPTLPVVFVAGNPVAQGFVASLSRPGKNLTGVAILTGDVSPKRIELLKEAVPGMNRLAILEDVTGGSLAVPDIRLGGNWQAMEAASRQLGIQTLPPLKIRKPEDLEGAFALAVKERVSGVLVLASPFFSSQNQRIVSLTAKSQLPAIYEHRGFVEAGGFMSYGPNHPDIFRLVAVYVDKILKGAKPADLPVEQPTQFELVVNLKTARTLGLTIPPSLLQRADQVIE